MPTHFKGTPQETAALDALIKLFRASNTVSGRLFGTLQKEHGLTESQLGVLEAIHFLGPMQQTGLCEKILRSGSNVTTVVDNLERNGLVKRERDANDRRVQVVHLTEAGRKLIARVFPQHVERVVDALSPLNRDEQKELGRLCRKLGLGNAA